ncbi:MAG: hypothetical protein ABIN48_05030 [Ginsengibacter sp.]
MRKVLHLENKATGEHKYYGSLVALFLDNKDLGISKFSLDRYDFNQPFENETHIIRSGFLFSAGDIRNAAE